MNVTKVSGLLPLIALTACSNVGSMDALAAPRKTTSITISAPNPLPTATLSKPYSINLAANGGSSPYTWAITQCSGACNTGLGFSPSGALYGTPQSVGTSSFTFRVTDASGNARSTTLNLTVAAADSASGSSSTSAPTSSALAITSPDPLPKGIVSAPYSVGLSASGGSSPYQWTIVQCSGACNTGLGFNASGFLSGTPQNAGTSTFTFKVTDATGNTASAARNVNIASSTSSPTSPSTSPSTSPLAITSPGTLPAGTISYPYSANLTGSGGTSPYTWSIAGCSGACNSGLTLSQSGTLSGTPSNSGTSTYNVTMKDGAGATISAPLSLTIVSAVTSGSNSGNTFYVATTGNNSNPCSEASPCATPDHAFSIASPGDTVQVAPGTYDYGNSAAQFMKSGTAGNYITVTCAARGACKIQNSVTGNSTVVYLGGSYIAFDGFEVTNTSSSGNNLGLYVTTPYVKIAHNTIHHIETDCGSNGGGGIQIAGSGSSNSGLHDITIDGNLIYDISYRNGSPSCTSSTVQTDGILAETAGTNLIVTNNVIYHTSGGWGILVGNSNATFNNVSSVIANNTVFSATGGIIIMSGNGTTISNNIVAYTGQQTGRCGISAPQGVAVTYLNNDLWNNNGGNYCLEWGTSDQSVHSGDISVDPALGTTFVNWKADGSGDYHEKIGSPTIDRGTMTAGAPAADFDSNPRPHGSGSDIGAYESQQ